MEKLVCALRAFFCKDAPGKADASNEAIKVIADDDQQQASKFLGPGVPLCPIRTGTELESPSGHSAAALGDLGRSLGCEPDELPGIYPAKVPCHAPVRPIDHSLVPCLWTQPVIE